MNSVEVAKKARSTLRRAFPGTKFSVTSQYDIRVTWTDDGPSVEQVRDTLVCTGCAKAETSWNGEPWLRAHGCSFRFDRYNAAKRAAHQLAAEQQHQKWLAQIKLENEVVRAAADAKRAQMPKIPSISSKSVHEQSAYDAFEALRLRAEADVASDTERQHRPSWAPPLILKGELLEICHELGYLTPDDKPIARLWATFADPKGSGKLMRERYSRNSLAGISCRGFQLHAGSTRQQTSQILFEAQRTESAANLWQLGPNVWWRSYESPKACKWEQLVRERAKFQKGGAYEHHNPPEWTKVDTLSQQIAVIDAEDLVAAEAHTRRGQLRQRVVELAQLRVLNFVGAPDVQMQLAGRLSGNCYVCFKLLTDPISLERGIGPDCWQHRINHIRLVADDLRESGKPVEAWVIAGRTFLPTAFIAEVLKELGGGSG
jgi:Family of unknown function (DUF6011)/Large polyvalent protein associated domain 29